jgi:hypothetical protein
MRKLYQIVAEAAKDVPVVYAGSSDFIVKRGEKVIFTFKGTGFQSRVLSKSNGYEKFTNVPKFRKGDLANIRAEEVDVDDSLYLYCKESTDHRYSMTKEEADERINLSVPNYFLKD